jgi:hypothetical protein
MRDCHGEHLFVELADGTISSLPEWMFRPECPGFLVGAPLIAVEALVALRDLIASLHTAAECAKASLNQPPKEEVSEAISQRSEPTTKSSASQRSGSGPTQRQATGTNLGGRGNARQRSTRSHEPSGKRRKR